MQPGSEAGSQVASGVMSSDGSPLAHENERRDGVASQPSPTSDRPPGVRPKMDTDPGVGPPSMPPSVASASSPVSRETPGSVLPKARERMGTDPGIGPASVAPGGLQHVGSVSTAPPGAQQAGPSPSAPSNPPAQPRPSSSPGVAAPQRPAGFSPATSAAAMPTRSDPAPPLSPQTPTVSASGAPSGVAPKSSPVVGAQLAASGSVLPRMASSDTAAAPGSPAGMVPAAHPEATDRDGPHSLAPSVSPPAAAQAVEPPVHELPLPPIPKTSTRSSGLVLAAAAMVALGIGVAVALSQGFGGSSGLAGNAAGPPDEEARAMPSAVPAELPASALSAAPQTDSLDGMPAERKAEAAPEGSPTEATRPELDTAGREEESLAPRGSTEQASTLARAAVPPVPVAQRRPPSAPGARPNRPPQPRPASLVPQTAPAGVNPKKQPTSDPAAAGSPEPARKDGLIRDAPF